MIHRLLLNLIVGASVSTVLWAQPKLSVQAADATKISLTWTGTTGATVVERRAPGGRYETLATVPTGSVYTDAAIDSMGIYQYRVHAPAAGSPSSIEVTAGAPPVGYSAPVLLPKAFADHEAAASWAKSTAMELDFNGDPALLYSVVDPAFDGSNHTELWFVHWDRAAWAWKPPVKAATYEQARVGVSLTRDFSTSGSTSVWATVTETEAGLELFTSSDDGASWKSAHQMRNGDHPQLGGSVALASGRLWWAYRVDYEGVYLLSGMLDSKPEQWTKQLLPMNELDMGSAGSQVIVAVDSQGRPGVAYFGYGPDYNVSALYWRPGDGKAQKILDSDGVQNDFHAVALTFGGAPKDQAKFLVELNRRKNGSADAEIWVVRYDGSAMSTAAKIPTDGGDHRLNSPFSIAVDGSGRTSVLLGRNGGTGTDTCGAPKLARAAQSAPFKTCSPDATKDRDANPSSFGLSLRVAANGKLYGAWADTSMSPVRDAKGASRNGLVLWREP